jgi:hypothetical protein
VDLGGTAGSLDMQESLWGGVLKRGPSGDPALGAQLGQDGDRETKHFQCQERAPLLEAAPTPRPREGTPGEPRPGPPGA